MDRQQFRFHYTEDRELIQLEGDIPAGIGKAGISIGYFTTIFYDVEMDDIDRDEVFAKCYAIAEGGGRGDVRFAGGKVDGL